MNKVFYYLEPIYKHAAKRIAIEIKHYLRSFHQIKPLVNREWYKQHVLYSIYPDAVIYDGTISPLKNLALHLPYIRNLGCHSLHILPFLASSMIDKGFDVTDYLKIRSDLGTYKDLISVIKAAKKSGLQLFMDMVLNHVSKEHDWAKKAINGDVYYQNYFITRKSRPQFIKKIHKHSAVHGVYKIRGKNKAVNIAFPELSGEIPHWSKFADYWYYHTYYPQQLDLNWLNPEVFIEIAKVMIYWGSHGFNFRLDAVPYIGKSSFKETDNNRYAHLIMSALKYIVHQVNPNTIILVETFEKLSSVIEYFGSTKNPGAELSYNFHLCTRTWLSLIKQDAKYIWRTLCLQENIPAFAE